MAPNVLAAVDARLRASNNSSPRSGTLRSGSGQLAPSSDSGVTSKASSLAPVVTHLTVFENTEAITSREQLYDLLNDDGDDEHKNNHGMSGFSLGRPKPKFHNTSSSSRSSRRTSISSSLAHSGIELNHKRSSASLHRPTRTGAVEGASITSPKAAVTSKGSRRGEQVILSAAAGRNGGSNKTMNSSLSLDSIESNPGLSPYREKSDWLKSKSRTSRRWRGICCVVGILAFIGVIAGITLGFVTRKGKVDGLAQPTSPEKPGDGPAKPPITEFTPDPQLRKAFYGVDYNPAKSLMPWCGVKLQDIIDDVIIISQIANRIRLYGMDCAQADLTFQALKLLNIKMGIVLTIWVDTNAETYQRQYDTLFKVLDTHGVDMVEGISVGNEVLFRKDQTLESLSTMMANVRAELRKRYPQKLIPVFTSEIGNNLNSALAEVSDEMSGNLHPYFSDQPPNMAADWTLQQYETLIAENPVKTNINGSISEVGWPSAPTSAVYNYWFEFKDEPWKSNPEVPVEPFWGLFDKDNKLKITIPNSVDNLAQHRQDITVYLNERLAAFAALHKDHYELDTNQIPVILQEGTKRHKKESKTPGLSRRSPYAAGSEFNAGTVAPTNYIYSPGNVGGLEQDEDDFEQSMTAEEGQLRQMENEDIVQWLVRDGATWNGDRSCGSQA
ncbi:hypothetical protein BG004_000315 [Podila humilis]|nr:hypothetical protein BG004_000315 [Podila humilis]